MQSFLAIRTENFLYVDKTKYAYDLVTQRQSFFLSRPRRFGKSVFLSTLKEVLLGKKELFEDLWIGKSDYKWPILPECRDLKEQRRLPACGTLLRRSECASSSHC